MDEILASTAWSTNADMILDVVKLGYLNDEWHTMDCTYGYGSWWKKWRPKDLVIHDIKLDGVDFRNLPHINNEFDAIAFDPPYKLCLDEETEILTRRGWQTIDTVQIGDSAYSINPETMKGEWQEITDLYSYNQSLVDAIVCTGRNVDFVSTPHHRWLVIDRKGNPIWTTSSKLQSHDRIPHSATWSETPIEATLDDALVELVAWYWTEGSRNYPSYYGHITQSHAVNSELCERIFSCFEKLYGPPTSDGFIRNGKVSFSKAWRVHNEERNRRFVFSALIGYELEQLAPNKIPTLAFLETLTASQRELFISTSLLADGQNPERLAQINKEIGEAFALACILDGRAITTIWRDDGNGLTTTIKRNKVSRPSRPGLVSEQRLTRMWCPTVEKNGTWLARRNGRIYFTGNSGTPTQKVDGRYGITECVPWRERHQLIREGMTECLRVLKPRGILLVKCQAQVSSGKIRWQPFEFTQHGIKQGAELVDRLNMLGYRPQPDGTRQIYSRQNCSTLLIFKKLPKPR